MMGDLVSTVWLLVAAAEVPSSTRQHLHAPLIFLYCPLVHAAREEQDLAADGGLASVHVANEHHVDVLPAVGKQFILAMQLLNLQVQLPST